MLTGDTIAAISSAVGAAARMIVRVSGPGARGIAEALSPGLRLAGRMVARHQVRLDEGLTFPAWVYVFPSPRSYTGEDLVEWHIPGNPLLARLILERMIALGARAAEAGEFTARAYFNGRIDLTEAEGVAATVGAHSEQELRAARQLMAGELARRLRPAMDLLAETLALVEVGIDFSEEDVSFLSRGQLAQRVGRVDAMLDELTRESARFERLAHEVQVVLVGRPNAGKSTLLNALAGHERAVVSPVAGTTRDVIWAPVALRRGIVHVTDGAGIGEVGSWRLAVGSEDAQASIERQMRERALRAVETADVLVLLREAPDERPVLELPRRPDLVVRSKADLGAGRDDDGLTVSACTGTGMDALRDRLDELAFGAVTGEPKLALNTRHLHEIAQARAALSRLGGDTSSLGTELVALELREALDAMGRILGSVSPDDLLTRIFSTFCIGK